MSRPTGDFELAGRTRIWGLPVVRLFCRAEQLAIAAAPSPPPRVVVVYVQAPGGGRAGADPRVIQAIVQDAITEGEQ